MSKIDTTYQTLDEIEAFTMADLRKAEAKLAEIKAGTYQRTEMDDALTELFPDVSLEEGQINAVNSMRRVLDDIAADRKAAAQ